MIQLKKRFITDTPFPYLPCSCRILGITIHTRADVDPVQIGDDLGRHIIIAHSLNYPFVKKMCFALFGALSVLNPGFHQRLRLRILVLLRFSFHLKYGVELMDEHVHLFRFSVEQIRMYGKDTVNVCQQNFALGCILRRQYIIPKFFQQVQRLLEIRSSILEHIGGIIICCRPYLIIDVYFSHAAYPPAFFL